MATSKSILDNVSSRSNVSKQIIVQVAKDNQQDNSVYLKKQVVLLTDYVPLNITDILNKNKNVRSKR